MKKPFVIILLIMCIPLLIHAQEDTLYKPRIYKTWITTTNNTEIQGVLYEIEDSAVLITNSLVYKDYKSGNFNKESLDLYNIGIIETRNKNSIINRSIIGLITGAALGAALGYASGDDPPCQYLCIFWFSAEDKARVGGTIGGISGAGIGALIGLIKVKIPINGSFQTFSKNKDRLKKYSYVRENNFKID